jgi:hypothetical protein
MRENADRHVLFGEPTSLSLHAPGYIGQQTVAGFATWRSTFNCFFLVLTDSAGGSFGLESLNDPYSRRFHFRRYTSLRGAAKRLRNF